MSSKRKIRRVHQKSAKSDLKVAVEALTGIQSKFSGLDLDGKLRLLDEIEPFLEDAVEKVNILHKRQEKLEGVLRVLIRRTASPSEIPELLALLDGEE